jgi:hypothetical protein
LAPHAASLGLATQTKGRADFSDSTDEPDCFPNSRRDPTLVFCEKD